MGKTPEKKANNDDYGDVKRKPIEDSMWQVSTVICSVAYTILIVVLYSPICYEDLKANDKLVWCKTSCGQNLHGMKVLFIY